MDNSFSGQTQELQTLREKLAEAEEMLRAIRAGEVDAIVVNGGGIPQVYTLKSASDTYRTIVEQMSEGALTVSSEGVILYGNAAGNQCSARSYWMNNGFSANVTYDIPNESRLEPQEWVWLKSVALVPVTTMLLMVNVRPL